ncbi:TonB-dependent receptor [Phenylobacterium sp.]|uniref:TonB-dependent receptor domain-containing protein n=1 Tax=Phenylobacterium sp. TaxID=1871053 RepID=UPI0025CC9F7F|nr:TonB-dependent receptor [Phenylobacterium sp.]
MLKSRYLNGASAVVFAITAVVAGAARAQTAADKPTSVEEVVVTGSFIAGTPKDTAIPVAVIGQAEIERRGSPSVLELIKGLPISGPVLGDSNQFSTAAQGRSGGGTINIRGLGPARTLVLMNGKRFAGYTADTNLLPVAAIGRVEILKDGAAATYGSDAIAGVANFITRKDFSGLETQADYRYVPGSKGDYTASILYGWVGDTSNILVSLGYQHRSELSDTDRGFTKTPYLTNPSGWSVLGNPGAFTIRGGAAGTTPLGFAVDANCSAVGGFAGFTGNTPACYFTYVNFDNLVEREDRYQAYAEFNSDVGDKAKFHVEGLYSQTSIPAIRFSPGYPETSGPNGPGSVNVFSVPSSNPGFNTFLQQTGNGALVGVATNALATLWRPFANGGNNSTGGLGGQKGSRKYEEIRISADLKGDSGFYGIGYDLGVTYISERQNQQTTDILIDRLQRALNGLGGLGCTGNTPGANGCQYYNPFSNAYPSNPALGLTNPGYVSANANDPKLVASLFDRQRFIANQETFVVDAVVNGKLPITLPGGGVGWAVGGQYRNITYHQEIGSPFYNAQITPCPVVGVTNCAFKTGPYIFLGQNIPLRLDQHVYALFGELNLPVTDAINAQLSARYEDYGGATGSTFNPEARLKWQIMDGIALRGSIGTSFRGPTSTNVAPTGVTGLSGIAAAGNNFKSVDFFGNPNVGPEKAFTYSVGTILKYGNLTATADYWRYRVRDQIVSVPANVIASAVAGTGNGSQLANCASAVRSLITFNNNNACTQGVTVGNDIARIRSDTTNGPTIKTDGIDVDVTYRFDDLMGGSLDLGANVSYVLHYKQAAFVFGGVTVSPAYEAAGFTNYNRLPGTIPDWRGQFYADYTYGAHNLRWTINYIDGADDDRGPTTVQTGPSSNCNVANAQAGTATNCKLTTFGLRVHAFITHDLTYRWAMPNDLTLTASVLNVLDEDPSSARLELSYDPFVGNPLGRSVKVGVKKKF